MANYTDIPNTFENVTTLKGMLAVPNATTGGLCILWINGYDADYNNGCITSVWV